MMVAGMVQALDVLQPKRNSTPRSLAICASLLVNIWQSPV